MKKILSSLLLVFLLAVLVQSCECTPADNKINIAAIKNQFPDSRIFYSNSDDNSVWGYIVVTELQVLYVKMEGIGELGKIEYLAKADSTEVQPSKPVEEDEDLDTY